MLTTLATLGSRTLFAQDDGFIGSPLFFIVGVVLLLALGGLFFFMRNKKDD